MTPKMVEIRDRMTFIPALAIRLDPSCEADRYLLARAGFGRDADSQGRYIQLVRIEGGLGPSCCDPYDWNDRTMRTAHMWLIENFDALAPGGVVDVEFILGEKPEVTVSEASS